MTLPPPAPLTDEMLEDCLQAIHRLEAQGRYAGTSEVAAFARILPDTAEEVLRELERRGLLQGGSPNGVTLSVEGRRQAAGILRRHRLSERLLADILGLPWDRVHDEAMRLEHALTPEAEARISTLLKNPETCPHGAPIPEVNGSVAPQPTRGLDRVAAGARVQIQQIVEEEPTFLRYLASLGLLPRAEIHVEEVAPFGGPLLVRVGDATYAIGRDVAAKILVRETGQPLEPQRVRRRRRGG
jgi:DtxR family Mn-dependent transcriptional regulator